MLNNVEGLDYVSSLTIQGVDDDLAMTGVVPLPLPGVVTSTVTSP